MGFRMSAEQIEEDIRLYRQYLDAHKDNCDDAAAAEIERKIKMMDIIAHCNDVELYTLFDLGTFNDIVFSYCLYAARDAGIEDEKIQLLLRSLRDLFDTKRAGEIMVDRFEETMEYV